LTTVSLSVGFHPPSSPPSHKGSEKIFTTCRRRTAKPSIGDGNRRLEPSQAIVFVHSTHCARSTGLARRSYRHCQDVIPSLL